MKHSSVESSISSDTTPSSQSIDTALYNTLIQNDYYALRTLPDGRVIGLFNFIYTIGLCYGLDESGYQGRYCYEKANYEDAHNDVLNWDGKGNPEGDWVVHK